MNLKLYNPDADTLGGLMPCRSPEDQAMLAAAWQEFDCDPLPTLSENLSAAGQRRERKRLRVTATAERFSRLMCSANPPRTEAEAVAKCVVSGWLLSWLLQQLAVSVVKFLWRKWHGQPQSATSGRSG